MHYAEHISEHTLSARAIADYKHVVSKHGEIQSLFSALEQQSDLSVQFVWMTLLKACIKHHSCQNKRRTKIEKVGLALIEAWLATSVEKKKQTMKPYKVFERKFLKSKAFN